MFDFEKKEACDMPMKTAIIIYYILKVITVFCAFITVQKYYI